MTHICISKLTIIGSDNGLSPGRRQAITWTNATILLIGPLGKNFSEILIGIQTFSFKKLHLKTSSAKWRLFCPGLNELITGTGIPITMATSTPVYSQGIIWESTTCWNWHFAKNIFDYIFLFENHILIQIALKFVSKGWINNMPTLVQIITWCQIGDKPLSKALMA